MQDLGAAAGQDQHAKLLEPHIRVASYEKRVNHRGLIPSPVFFPSKSFAEECQVIFGVGVGAVHRMLSSNSNVSMLPDIQELRLFV